MIVLLLVATFVRCFQNSSLSFLAHREIRPLERWIFFVLKLFLASRKNGPTELHLAVEEPKTDMGVERRPSRKGEREVGGAL